MTECDPLKSFRLVLAEADESVPRLALRPREAAKAIGISERLLFDLDVPRCRLNRTVLYPVELLRQWLIERATGAK